MIGNAPKSTTDARSSIAAQAAALLHRELSAFDDRSLAWLAITPAWTERLAEATDFPTGKWNLAGFLDHTEEVRLAKRGPLIAKEDVALRRTRDLMVLWPFLAPKRRERLAPVLRDGIPAVGDE